MKDEFDDGDDWTPPVSVATPGKLKENLDTGNLSEKYPTYLDADTVRRIEERVERRAWEMFAVLRAELGRVHVKAMDHSFVWETMRLLAIDVAHQAAGYMSGEGARQARQSSLNLLNGVLAGIKIGQGEGRDNAPPSTEES